MLSTDECYATRSLLNNSSTSKLCQSSLSRIKMSNCTSNLNLFSPISHNNHNTTIHRRTKYKYKHDPYSSHYRCDRSNTQTTGKKLQKTNKNYLRCLNSKNDNNSTNNIRNEYRRNEKNCDNNSSIRLNERKIDLMKSKLNNRQLGLNNKNGNTNVKFPETNSSFASNFSIFPLLNESNSSIQSSQCHLNNTQSYNYYYYYYNQQQKPEKMLKRQTSSSTMEDASINLFPIFHQNNKIFKETTNKPITSSNGTQLTKKKMHSGHTPYKSNLSSHRLNELSTLCRKNLIVGKSSDISQFDSHDDEIENFINGKHTSDEFTLTSNKIIGTDQGRHSDISPGISTTLLQNEKFHKKFSFNFNGKTENEEQKYPPNIAPFPYGKRYDKGECFMSGYVPSPQYGIEQYRTIATKGNKWEFHPFRNYEEKFRNFFRKNSHVHSTNSPFVSHDQSGNETRKNYEIDPTEKLVDNQPPVNDIAQIFDEQFQHLPYFFEMCSRRDAEGILMKCSINGVFLVRKSINEPGRLTLSVFHKPRIHHYKIYRERQSTGESENDWYLYFMAEKYKFPSLEQLIDFHSSRSGGLITILNRTNLLPKPNIERTKHKRRKDKKKFFHETNNHQMIFDENQSTSSDCISDDITAGTYNGNKRHSIDMEYGDDSLIFLEKIGQGQFGVVKKAVLNTTKQLVAVKLVKQTNCPVNELMREADTMKKLSHPNLVKFIGLYESDGQIGIVTEYMKHGSLLSFLLRNRLQLLTLPHRLISITLQVCNAMVYLESNNLIHRDLAARNCLVGEKGRVKVADFGLARFVENNYFAQEGAKFPVKWSAIEVLLFRKFSTKSDVWAYGVLLWEVFTGGMMPFGMHSNVKAAELIAAGEMLKKPEACSQEYYDEIMKQCWEKDEDKRISFRQLQKKLKKYYDIAYREADH
ncbi:hypothetical protein SNEBB_003618 [Seison nebaliae]|nr:hypothetical protein SNEBB_003618 [Seison nebaliae]